MHDNAILSASTVTLSDLDIRLFDPAKDQDAVVAFVMGIQNDEFGLGFKITDEPDMIDIATSYAAGRFWVATLPSGEIAGTIALQPLGGGHAVMRKMFVKKELRGAPLRLAAHLYGLFIDYLQTRDDLHTLWLDTPSVLHAAHAFYRRRGWKEVSRNECPEGYVYPDGGSLIFKMTIDN